MSAGKQNQTKSLILGLPFIHIVDSMLLEEQSASDVARFIQDEGYLKEVTFKTLANALAEHRKSLFPDGEPESNPIRKPSMFSKMAFAKMTGGIDELIELEALYLTQRQRIDDMIVREATPYASSDDVDDEGKKIRRSRPVGDVGSEIAMATDILMKRIAVKKAIGLIGDEAGGELRLTLDVRGYSKRTAESLSQPESRRRVVSMIERVRAHTDRVAIIEAVGTDATGSDNK